MSYYIIKHFTCVESMNDSCKFLSRKTNFWSLDGLPTRNGYQQSFHGASPDPVYLQDVMEQELRSIPTWHAFRIPQHAFFHEFGIHLSRFIKHVKGKCILKWAREHDEKERNKAKQWLKTCWSLVYFFHQRMLLSLMGISHILSREQAKVYFVIALRFIQTSKGCGKPYIFSKP